MILSSLMDEIWTVLGTVPGLRVPTGKLWVTNKATGDILLRTVRPDDSGVEPDGEDEFDSVTDR